MTATLGDTYRRPVLAKEYVRAADLMPGDNTPDYGTIGGVMAEDDGLLSVYVASTMFIEFPDARVLRTVRPIKPEDA